MLSTNRRMPFHDARGLTMKGWMSRFSRPSAGPFSLGLIPTRNSALSWNDFREYELRYENGVPLLAFADNELDQRIVKRYEVKSKNLGFRLPGSSLYDPALARPRNKPTAGMDQDQFEALREKYPSCPKCAEDGNSARAINASSPFQCPMGHEWISPLISPEPEYKFLGNRLAQNR